MTILLPDGTEVTLGILSTPIFLIAQNLAPLEGIPVLGIPFMIIDFILGYIAGFLSNFGLK